MSIFEDVFLLPFKVAINQTKKISDIILVKKCATSPVFEVEDEKNIDGKIIDEK
jgi:hypothetical protein